MHLYTRNGMNSKELIERNDNLFKDSFWPSFEFCWDGV